MGALTFHKPDTAAFPFLSLAREAIKLGGAMPAVMNAADEVAVSAFLEGRLSFTGIYRVVTDTFNRLHDRDKVSSLNDIIASDREARRIAKELI